ncbi:MAG TPA: ABC transporter ATP-binding protein [Alphaproteobacteria bacterium]|nr:ABC transporter ATP-binding protein [Alphaproteobacteria bacterium]
MSVHLRSAAPIPLAADFACASGEVIGLVGPSGSGKSTILRCIAGLRRPSEGKVVAAGQVWLDTASGIDERPQARAAGMVFQNYALFPHMTALANVAAAVPEGDRLARARALLELVHLAGLEDRRPAQLSGGQQQRVAIARALARDPKVLLLDEPFAAVDQVTRRKLQRELVLLRRSVSMPIVLVTHDLEEAAMLSDRMCILHRGQTLQVAPPAELMTRPATPLVARLIDLRNVFDGRIEAHDAAAQTSLLRWRDRLLEAAYAPHFAAGERVSWVIPPGAVVLHRRDRPSRGERENPVSGVVGEFVALGDTANLSMQLDGSEDLIIAFSVPLHVARRNGVDKGEAITVSLLKEGIHCMPAEAN